MICVLPIKFATCAIAATLIFIPNFDQLSNEQIDGKASAKQLSTIPEYDPDTAISYYDAQL